MQVDLSGQNVLVTGASSGLGRHFALMLAQSGARVALGARRVDRLESLQAEIEAFDGRAVPLAMDVCDPASVKAAVDSAETELGPISVLVNNAGVGDSGPSESFSLEAWDRTLDTNLRGVWITAQETAKHMIRLGHGGSIINIASILGKNGSGHVAAYCAAKAGVINLTKSLAIDWARYDIRVNAIAPGYFVTDINREFLNSPMGEVIKGRIPQRRFGQSGELDGAMLLLASDLSRYMTGSTITVDGGQSIVT
ncbi:SDR family NAD(P)-dependent oxidoreductase [Rhodovibrionaceae bacterium A322]